MTYEQRIFNKAISLGMPQFVATCITLQAAHETGGFTSNVFKTCNNLNGYKWVGQKTAAGACLKSPEGDFYAKYGTIEDSVNEVVQWIRRRQKEGIFPADLNQITSLDEYAALMKRAGWYGDTLNNYTAALYYWSNQLADRLKTPVGASAVLLLLILGIIYRKKLFS